MGFDDDLLEGLDDEFEDEPFPSDDFEEFPDFEERAGPSPVFLIAGGLIVATFLVLLVIVLLLLNIGGDDGTDATNTAIAQTNDAVRIALEATGTRQSFIDATLTATRQEFEQVSTQNAINTATGEAVAYEVLLDASRTAIVDNATATESVRLTQVEETFIAQTMTVDALTPTVTPLPTFVIQIVDENGNPLPGGAVIEIWLDDGDGVFNPQAPSGPTPTPQGQSVPTIQPTQTPTNTPQTIPSLVASPTLNLVIPTLTPTEGSSGGDGAPTEGGAAGFRVEEDSANTGSYRVYARFEGNSGPVVYQGGFVTRTPTPTPLAPGSGDVLVATIVANPDGSFTVSGLPPGNYFLIINGQTVPFPVPEEPTTLEIPISGTPVTFFVFPNVVFPTSTATPTQTNTPLSPEDRDATATVDAQLTSVAATLQAIGVTMDPTIVAISTNVQNTRVAETATEKARSGTIVPAGSPSAETPIPTATALPRAGFFEDLGGDSSPAGLTFLALVGLGLVAVIVMIRRLRAQV